MKRKRQVKGIFFDAGNTLFETKAPIGFLYSQMAAKYGVKIDARILDRRFKTAFQKSPPLAFPGASGSELACLEFRWWYHLVRSVFDEVDFPLFDPFFKELYHFFGDGTAWQLFPETKEVLRRLRRSQYTLGIISNFDSRLISICDDLGIMDYFNIIVFSSREVVAKPHVKIFEEALKRTGLSPSESIYLGDDIKNDVTGPKNMGMEPIFLDRTGTASEPSAAVSIKNLRGIYPLLKRRN